MSYLQFIERTLEAGRKTKQWDVKNQTDAYLGRVSFSGAWRKFVFLSVGGSQFDAGCLQEIIEFLNKQTKEWKDNL